MGKKRLVVGISGASGAPLAKRLLEEIADADEWESHLVISSGGRQTIEEECQSAVDEFVALADVCYGNADIGASIASGTFLTEGMVIIPCSMKTAAGVAHGYSDNLLLRAADVAIKEQKQLVLVPRETPLSRIHLDNLAYLAGIPNVFILPPVISYYHHPVSLADVERQIVGRILERFGIGSGPVRWERTSA